MPQFRARTLAGVLSSLLVAAPAFAENANCRFDSFRGAATAIGAETTMHVRNTGEPCAIRNFGLPAEHSHPATSGRITREPAHGKADFVAPDATYVPTPGYVGEDAFAYEARAVGASDRPLFLSVRVKVLVSAP